jgi:hypothetical protein
MIAWKCDPKTFRFKPGGKRTMNDTPTPAGLAGVKRYIELIAWAVVIVTILCIPLKIIQLGYLPTDDALRHAAKAVSGKSWSDILILNQTYQIDHEYGWNLLLEKIYQWTHWDAETLVVFSVVGLFVLWGWAVLPWLRRPEAWLGAILVAAVSAEAPARFLTGRPYTISSVAVMALLFLWYRCGAAPPRKWMLGFMALLVAASTYFHGVWYLWLLPIVAFLLAEQFRWGVSLFFCWMAGVAFGSLLTGHLFEYPIQALKLAKMAVGMHATARTMAVELTPSGSGVMSLILLGGVVVTRQLANLKGFSILKNPAFWLAAMSWVLAFKVRRFMDDWGWPALLVLVTCELELLLIGRMAADGVRRLILVLGLAMAVFLCLTSDIDSRWSGSLVKAHLSAKDPSLTGWMPDQGGIFYTADMGLFYDTFFSNPKGDWRYLLGFEPTWMPKEDFETYHKILWNFGDYRAYEPWVQKMKPADRLAIKGGRGNMPQIPELEWNYGVSDIWIGRLPRTNTPPANVPAPALNR